MNKRKAIEAINEIIKEAEAKMYKGHEVDTTKKVLRQIEEMGLSETVEEIIPGYRTNPRVKAYHRLNAIVAAANDGPGTEHDGGWTAYGDYDGSSYQTGGSKLWQALNEQEAPPSDLLDALFIWWQCRTDDMRREYLGNLYQQFMRFNMETNEPDDELALAAVVNANKLLKSAKLYYDQGYRINVSRPRTPAYRREDPPPNAVAHAYFTAGFLGTTDAMRLVYVTKLAAS